MTTRSAAHNGSTTWLVVSLMIVTLGWLGCPKAYSGDFVLFEPDGAKAGQTTNTGTTGKPAPKPGKIYLASATQDMQRLRVQQERLVNEMNKQFASSGETTVVVSKKRNKNKWIVMPETDKRWAGI